jgi:VWFA-related protein
MTGWTSFLLVPGVVGFLLAQQTIRSATDLVPVDVLVIGKDGKPVKNLTIENFTLKEDGRDRPITVFSADRRPFSLAVVHDSTWSMELMAGQTRAVSFIEALLGALEADDQVTLGSLARRVVAPTLDKSMALRAFRDRAMVFRTDTTASGRDLEMNTETGLDWATRTLGEIPGRKVIMILTDGRSPNQESGLRFSQSGYRMAGQTAEAIVQAASRVDASVHIVAFDDTLVEEDFLRAVVSAGGSATLVTREADLASVCKDFVNDLHTEYLLGFEPSKLDGKAHKIEVKVDRSGLKIRARSSYFAANR